MKFSDIIGNEQAVARIRGLVDSGHIPHALLIYGDACVPKLALALATAQYIHCQNRTPEGDSCGVCPQCRQHESHNHVDTFFSFPYVRDKNKKESTISDDYISQWKTFIDQGPVEHYQNWLQLLKNENAQPIIYGNESDNIIRKLSLSSYSTKYKILIMWLPEKMHPACANGLLKMIEEPDPDTIFLLVSDNAKEILPTIYSRTQRIELRRPGLNQVAEYLAKRYNIDMQEALAIAAPADGDIALAEESLNSDNENHDFHEQFVSLMRMAYIADVKALKAWSESVADYKREKSRRFLNYAARLTRENFIYNLKMPSLNFLTREEQQFSTRFSPFINEANVEMLERGFTNAANDIAGNANAKIVLFDLALIVSGLIKLKP